MMTENIKKNIDRLGLEKPEPKPLVKTVIGVTSVTSAILLGLAAPSLLDSSTLFDYAKIGFLTLGAGAVTYGVNTVAVERIAPLWAVGFKSAGLAGLIAILSVGTALFTSTYAGLVRPEVSELALQEHGKELGRQIDQSYAQALEAGRVVAVIRANVNDREQNLACEIATSCLSEHKSGGDGPVARLLRSQVERANGIAGELESSQADLSAALRTANDKLDQYNKMLADKAKTLEDRKVGLQRLSAEILQSISALKETSPQGLLGAYLGEIDAGVSLAGKPAATRNINALQRKYAENLRSAIVDESDQETSAPEFPAKTGVAETLDPKWLLHFFPVALFVGVLELVWPLLIYLISYLVLSYNVKRTDPPAPNANKPGPFDILFAPTPADDQKATRPNRSKRRTRRNNEGHRSKLNGSASAGGRYAN